MKILFVGNTDWHLANFRLPLALGVHAAGHEVVLVSPPGPYVARIQEAGLRHVPFKLSPFGRSIHADLDSLCDLIGIYRREAPDLVHHFSVKPVIYGSLAARAAHVRCVVNAFPGLGVVFAQQNLQARLLRRVIVYLYRLAMMGRHTRALCQNRDDLADLERLGVVRRGTGRVVRGSGVSTRTLRPSRVGTTGPPIVLFGSRLLADKGVRVFVEAARHVRAGGVSARFLIAGGLRPGHPSAIAEDEVESWRQEGSVEVLGHRDDILDLIRKASLVVLPTVYGEGVPRILLEAASLGRAVIATDVRGCREIVHDDVSGLLVPPSDAEVLASAMVRMLDDDTLRERLAAGARALVEREFDEALIIKGTLRVYEEAVA